MVGTHHIQAMALPIAFLIFILLLSTLSIGERVGIAPDKSPILLQRSENRKLPLRPVVLIFAVIGFSVPVLYLYSGNFTLAIFCLMNRSEPLCRRKWSKVADSIDCYKLSRRTSTLNISTSGYSEFIETDGNVQCTLESLRNYYVIELDYGVDKEQPHNFVLFNNAPADPKHNLPLWDDRNTTQNYAWLNLTALGLNEAFVVEVLSARQVQMSNDTTLILSTQSARMKIQFLQKTERFGERKTIFENSTSILLLYDSSSSQSAAVAELAPFTLTVNDNYTEYTPVVINKWDSDIASGATMLVIDNSVLLFGGMHSENQIRELHTASPLNIIRRVGNLPFDFMRGRATYFNGTTYLCFPQDSNPNNPRRHRICYTRYFTELNLFQKKIVAASCRPASLAYCNA